MQLTTLTACALAWSPWTNALSASLNGKRSSIGQVAGDRQAQHNSIRKRDIDPSLLYTEYNFSTPIDHFQNETKYEPHGNGSFPLRYWFDATYYKPGGPVIILQSGETDASTRLPFLQKGLLHELAVATNGIGVVLEHRYYGTSFPTPDLSTGNLRFLTTDQAMADEAYFAQNIQFPGLEKYGDLTSKTTAYLGYGGSYAGAFNAFLRVQYPDVFWGTISSSGVTKAIYDFWEYYEPVATYAPQDCVAAQKTLTHIVDNILIGKNDTALTNTLKTAFGLENITHVADFANQLAQGVGNWQSLNWDPAISSPEFYNYCGNISDVDTLYPATEPLRSTAEYLIGQGGYSANASLVNQMLNYIGYVNLTVVSSCDYEQDSLAADWRSWPYQYCTEWGFLQTGSGVPQDQLPMISRTLDLAYEMLICNYAFGIYGAPDLEAVNKYGGYNISYPRLAIVDGEWDPWRPATPHAIEYGAKDRVSTASEPFIQIADAVHHWDENGVFPNQTTATFPPQPVADTQKLELQFVQEWMQEWELKCLIQGGGCS
ncbi:hypothetical protein LTR78_009522 [Recurvomyces mirabilis]|uniref:Uncharacterized protein n=1 Tax=Recurvomyces mirabilis TaxID=574656 RepID=A0AAE0WGH6_9PEZI|nr:hypothetical protein LTR78_009522 [Recurvomyces mirabilis]KAK5150023.1 hypothetical protein LTS14_010495 [Recurvomyces mirabilis]